MYLSLVELFGSLTAFALFARAAIPGYTQVNGVTRLLGSSFGVPGLNLTFDYVVSTYADTYPPATKTITHWSLLDCWWWHGRSHSRHETGRES